jgi:Fe-S cluster assembly iron-binding protein IscA
MITLTERARKHLEALLAEHRDPSTVLRLAVHAPGQFGLVTDRQREGDQVLEHQGRIVLLVDGHLAGLLQGAVVDCEQAAEGPRLVVSRPGKR